MTYTWTDNAMQGAGACDVDKVNNNLMHLKYDISTVPRNYISELIPSNNSTDSQHDIDISEGECSNNDNSGSISLSSTITKQIDANWSEGNNAGGFPSGLTLSANTWYHIFVIAKSDGTVDAGFDTSLTATNLLSDATSYIKYRRIGSVLTDGSSNIINGTWTESLSGVFFRYNTRIQDARYQYITGVQTPTLSAPPNKLVQLSTKGSRSSTGAYVIINQTDESVLAPTQDNCTVGCITSTGGIDNSEILVRVDANSQIRCNGTGSSTLLVLNTIGYIDERIA